MKKKIVIWIGFLFKPFFAKKRFQDLFKLLYYLALKGMNYTPDEGFDKSGELSVLKLVKKRISQCNKQSVLFDVGANIGNYSKLLNDQFNRHNVKIYAFEPSRGTFDTLKENISLFTKVECMNLGFGNKEEDLELFKSNEGSDLASLYDRGITDTIEIVKITTIDTFCKKNQIEKIDFLKIDIEGNEYKCLQGAKDLLSKRKIKFIQFEFGKSNVNARVFFKDIYVLLSEYSFIIYRVLKDGLEPIEEYNETLEIFYTTNYLAVLND